MTCSVTRSAFERFSEPEQLTEPLGNQVLRGECDFVDSHICWDHPNSWPTRGSSIEGWARRSAIADDGRRCGPRAPGDRNPSPSASSTMSPNAHRHEGGLLMAPPTSGQDGLYRFSYSHQRDRSFGPMGMTFFDWRRSICQASTAWPWPFLRGDLHPRNLSRPSVPEDLLTASLPRAETRPRLRRDLPPQ